MNLSGLSLLYSNIMPRRGLWQQRTVINNTAINFMQPSVPVHTSYTPLLLGAVLGFLFGGFNFNRTEQQLGVQQNSPKSQAPQQDQHAKDFADLKAHYGNKYNIREENGEYVLYPLDNKGEPVSGKTFADIFNKIQGKNKGAIATDITEKSAQKAVEERNLSNEIQIKDGKITYIDENNNTRTVPLTENSLSAAISSVQARTAKESVQPKQSDKAQQTEQNSQSSQPPKTTPVVQNKSGNQTTPTEQTTHAVRPTPAEQTPPVEQTTPAVQPEPTTQTPPVVQNRIDNAKNNNRKYTPMELPEGYVNKTGQWGDKYNNKTLDDLAKEYADVFGGVDKAKKAIDGANPGAINADGNIVNPAKLTLPIKYTKPVNQTTQTNPVNTTSKAGKSAFSSKDKQNHYTVRIVFNLDKGWGEKINKGTATIYAPDGTKITKSIGKTDTFQEAAIGLSQQMDAELKSKGWTNITIKNEKVDRNGRIMETGYDFEYDTGNGQGAPDKTLPYHIRIVKSGTTCTVMLPDGKTLRADGNINANKDDNTNSGITYATSTAVETIKAKVAQAGYTNVTFIE